MEKRKKFWSESNKTYSFKNTPMWTKQLLPNLKINENNIEYPNMTKAYEKVSKFFNISKYRFILTNGCENALNIVLSMIRHKDKKVKNFYYEKPGWQLAKYCAYRAGFDDDKIKSLDYIYGSRNNSYLEPMINLYESIYHKNIKETDIVYTTLDYNGWFFHDNINNDRYKDICKAKYRIYDDSYTLSYLINEKMKEDLSDENTTTFVVASLSKVFGAGYKLGIILMDEEWYDEAMKCAEQYISSSAYTLINSLNKISIYRQKNNYNIENYGSCIYNEFKSYINSLYVENITREMQGEKLGIQYNQNMNLYDNKISNIRMNTIYKHTNYISFLDLISNSETNKETDKFIKKLFSFNKDNCKFISNITIKDYYDTNKIHTITRVQPFTKELIKFIHKL